MTTVRQIMISDPVTCREDETLSDAARRMWDYDVGSLPVTDAQGRAIGMITDRDIAMAAYTQGKALDQVPTRAAMSQQLYAAHPKSSVREIEDAMMRHRVRRIPVIDDSGRVVGIVSLNDLARHATAGAKATVTPEELTTVMRAVCEPRQASTQWAAAQ
jgi:CBS domain-containing protein